MGQKARQRFKGDKKERHKQARCRIATLAETCRLESRFRNHLKAVCFECFVSKHAHGTCEASCQHIAAQS